MSEKKDLAYQVTETLMQVSLELEASAQAAREAAGCVADRRALWAAIQRMYGRLNQANYFVDRLKALADTVAPGRPQTGGPGGS